MRNALEIKDAYASGKLMKQEAGLKEGIDKELAKKIVAHVKDAKLKVQASIQGERVSLARSVTIPEEVDRCTAGQNLRYAAAVQ